MKTSPKEPQNEIKKQLNEIKTVEEKIDSKDLIYEIKIHVIYSNFKR